MSEPRSQRRPDRRKPRASAPRRKAKRGTLPVGTLAAAAATLLGIVGLLVIVGSVLVSDEGASSEDTMPEEGAKASEGGMTATDESAATIDLVANPGADASDGGAATDDEQPTASDEEAIQTLARRSIEVLPAGQWPSLYDSYSSEFQQRCPREEFNEAGVDAAIELGDDLRLLRFNRLDSLTIDGSSAQAVITGEIAGQGAYQIQAAFRKEDGGWKIAPAPDTQGCEAFLSG